MSDHSNLSDAEEGRAQEDISPRRWGIGQRLQSVEDQINGVVDQHIMSLVQRIRPGQQRQQQALQPQPQHQPHPLHHQQHQQHQYQQVHPHQQPQHQQQQEQNPYIHQHQLGNNSLDEAIRHAEMVAELDNLSDTTFEENDPDTSNDPADVGPELLRDLRPDVFQPGHPHDPPQQTDQQNNEFGILMLRKSPYVFILAGFFLYDHIYGVSVVLSLLLAHSGLAAGFIGLVSNTTRSNIRVLIKKIMLLSGVAVTYIVLFTYISIDHDFSTLLLKYPTFEINGVAALLWIILLNDSAIKFGSLGLKLLFSLLPESFVNARRKGRWYAVMEWSSQLYRQIVSALPWSRFIGCSWFISCFILGIYWCFKTVELISLLKQIFDSIQQALSTLSHGTRPSAEELEKESECAVCHDELQQPVKLSCKHIFCEECSSRWLEKQRTCPMCRSPVVKGDTSYRDGDSIFLQWY